MAVEYSLVLPADGFQIQGLIIRGGSRRGVMYGLLEAADQLRERKTLVPMKATPRFDIRAARLRASDEVLARPEREWREFVRGPGTSPLQPPAARNAGAHRRTLACAWHDRASGRRACHRPGAGAWRRSIPRCC